MQWTDINWNPAKAILPFLLTRDAFITVSWHKSPRPGSGSTRRPLQSKQTALFMISYVLRSKVNRHASQTSWRCNSRFTTGEQCVCVLFFFFFYLCLNKGRQTEVEEYCMVSRKRLKGMTVSCILALLMVHLLSNTIKVATMTLLGPHHREEKLCNTLFQG